MELPVLSWPMLQEEERAWLHHHGQKPSFLECMTTGFYNKICLDAAHRDIESMPKMIGRILKRKGKTRATDQSIFSSWFNRKTGCTFLHLILQLHSTCKTGTGLWTATFNISKNKPKNRLKTFWMVLFNQASLNVLAHLNWLYNHWFT